MAFQNSINSRELVVFPSIKKLLTYTGVRGNETGFPTKLYTFTSAIESGAFADTGSVKQYLLDILEKNLEIYSKKNLFGIAAGWGYEKEGKPVKAMDIFSYKFDREWGICNPDVESWVFKDGVEDTGKERTCETSFVFLGAEAQLRRNCKDLVQYLHSWPEIGILGPSRQFP